MPERVHLLKSMPVVDIHCSGEQSVGIENLIDCLPSRHSYMPSSPVLEDVMYDLEQQRAAKCLQETRQTAASPCKHPQHVPRMKINLPMSNEYIKGLDRRVKVNFTALVVFYLSFWGPSLLRGTLLSSISLNKDPFPFFYAVKEQSQRSVSDVATLVYCHVHKVRRTLSGVDDLGRSFTSPKAG